MPNWKQATKELVKLNLGNVAKNIIASNTLSANSYKSGFWFFDNADGGDKYFNYSSLNSAVTAFKKCPHLTAILVKKASAYINGKTWVLDSKGKEVNNLPAQRIRKLLKQPNPFQSWPEFEAQGKIFRDLFGFNVILPIKPVGFDNTYAKALYNLPPQYISIYLKNTPFWQVLRKEDLILRIEFNTPDGQSSVLDKESIVIQKTIFPSMDTVVIPNSPIEPIQQNVNNIIGALQSRGVLIDQRGALGILSQEIDPQGAPTLSPEEKDNIQKDFMKYGLLRGQYKFVIAPRPIKWQQMGVPVQQLMLFEEIKDNVEVLCDTFGYPFPLLSNAKGTTFSNLKEASKLLYQNTIIPESTIDYAGWNNFFECEKYGIDIQKDYSSIPVLQEDKKNLATARNMLTVSLLREFYNNWITFNRVLELLEEDTVPGMDKYYYQLLAEGMTFGTITESNSLTANNNNNGQQGSENEQQSGQEAG